MIKQSLNKKINGPILWRADEDDYVDFGSFKEAVNYIAEDRYFFEYCDKYCKELFGTNVDKVKLLTEFMNSQFRRKMEPGHPRFLSQSAKDLLIQWIEVDYGNDLSDFSIGRKKNEYRTNQFYWIGWMYAYIHYKTGLSSKSIVSRLPIEEMLSHYYLGHEIS